ncbi:MAG: CSLREA domain-containing protein [Chloroflexi bacterium]|nr:CSLREA domain-containing protein [Chloroflexota bacterium]
MRSAILVWLLLLSLVVPVAGQSPRVVFVVDSTKDKADDNPGDGTCADSKGRCTLRAAIMEANALAGDDQITLPAGTYLLTKDASDETGGDLDITDGVTITGDDPATTIIDASGLTTPDRAVHIDAALAVSLVNLTITGGNVVDNGGGILTESVTSLTSVVLTGNTAGEGGGVKCISCGGLTLQGVRLYKNTVTGGGGGLYVESSLLFADTVVIADNTSEGSSGGASLFGVQANINRLTLDGNTAVFDGGGLRADTTLMTATDLLVTGNTSQNHAGGIELYNSDVQIVDALFTHNTTAINGGSIYVGSSSVSLARVSILDSVAANGGGLHASFSDVAVINSTIARNSATAGGAIFIQNPPTETKSFGLLNSTIYSNTITGGAVDEAGGIDAEFLRDGTLTLYNTILAGNGSRECIGTLTSMGGNLLPTSDATCTFAAQLSDTTGVTDPQLNPVILDAPTGLAAIYAPQPAGAASNAGDNATCLNIDQRQLARPNNGANPCDVGAVEGMAVTPLVNGSMEDGDDDGVPDGWTGSDLSGDKVKCNKVDKTFAVLDACAMRFKDSTGKLKQTVTLPVAYTGALEFGALIDTGSTLVSKPVKITAKDAAGDTLFKAHLEPESPTYGYEVIKATTSIGTDISEIKVIVKYGEDSGKMYVDAVWVWPALGPVPRATMERGAILPPPAAPDGFRGNN